MSRPNILVITTDQQRWDALGANGNDEIHTPNLDQLAAEGINYERAFVQAPVCMPSRASYMTGRYPSELDIYTNGIPLPESVRTAPTYFDSYDFHTASLGKLHFLPHAKRDHTQPHPSYGFDQLEVSDAPGAYPDDYRAWVKRRKPSQLDKISLGRAPHAEQDNDIVHRTRTSTAEVEAFAADSDLTHTSYVAETTLEYLEEHANDRFLCFSSFFTPHNPFVAPQEYLELYDPSELSIPDYPDAWEDRRQEYDYDPDDPPWKRVTFSDDELRQVKQGYFALVSEIDHYVGQILNRLDELGVRENTLIVFTSDHGEDLGQHLKYGKGYPGYDSISRVPFIVSWPEGIENPGRTESGLVELVDLLPTLIEAAGIQVPSDLQGRSLFESFEADHDWAGRESALLEANSGRVLRTDQYRYAITPDGDERLFDLDEDPEEYHDMTDDPAYRDVLTSMRKRLLERTSAIAIGAQREKTAAY